MGVVMRCFELVDMDVAGGENVWFDLSAAFNPGVFQSHKININANVIVNVNVIKNKCNIKQILFKSEMYKRSFFCNLICHLKLIYKMFYYIWLFQLYRYFTNLNELVLNGSVVWKIYFIITNI